MFRDVCVAMVGFALSLAPAMIANAEDSSQSQQPIPLLAPGQGASSEQPQPATPPFGSGSAPQSQAGVDFFKALREVQQKQQGQPPDAPQAGQDPKAGQDALIKLFDQIRQQQQPAQPPPPPERLLDEASRIQGVRMKLPTLRFGPEASVEERQQADAVFGEILAIQDQAVQDELVTLFRAKEQAAYAPGAAPAPRQPIDVQPEPADAAWQEDLERERLWEDAPREEELLPSPAQPPSSGHD